MSDVQAETTVPDLRVHPIEREYGNQLEASREQAANLLLEHGGLILRDVFTREEIQGLRASIWERYDLNDRDKRPPASLQVGDARWMIALALKEASAPAWLYGNPILLLLLIKLLGADMVLNSITMVVAYPGALAQRQHRDNPLMFGDTPENRAASVALPPYAITVAIPLVDLTPETGTTGLWYGTHRDPGMAEATGEPAKPYVEMGSVYLMDYRLRHQGLANASAVARPVLYLVFTRPWYTDLWNFFDQAPVTANAADLAAVPPVYKSLFKFVRPQADA